MATLQITCTDCGFTSENYLSAKVHSCYVQQQGGRCEDYPCCGHTDGDGCQTLASHTSEYWSELMQRDPDWYDYMDQEGWPEG